MALPTTSLSFSALQTEYGNSNPISLSEYYRGGLNVPAGQTSGFGTIPTSGAINMGVFRGTTKLVSGGVVITTGSTSYIVPGGKGTAGHSLFSYGFGPGTSIANNGREFRDYDNFYSLPFGSTGSYNSGVFIGAGGLQFLPVEIVWHSFSSEDSGAGYNENQLVITITGNIGGATGGAGSTGTAFTPHVNGSAIAGSRAGVWGGAPGGGGSGQTVFLWRFGTRPNTGGGIIPGSDYSLATTNPFGSDGSTPTITLL